MSTIFDVDLARYDSESRNNQLCSSFTSSAVEGFETTLDCIVPRSLVSYTKVQHCALACHEDDRPDVMRIWIPSQDYSFMSFHCFGSTEFFCEARPRTEQSELSEFPVPADT
jgi:hypothetical protein